MQNRKKTVELPFSRNKVLLFCQNYSEIIYEHFLWKEVMNGKMIMPMNCAHKTDTLLMFNWLHHVGWWRFKGIAALYSVGIVQIISPFSLSSTSMINYTTILKDCCREGGCIFFKQQMYFYIKMRGVSAHLRNNINIIQRDISKNQSKFWCQIILSYFENFIR